MRQAQRVDAVAALAVVDPSAGGEEDGEVGPGPADAALAGVGRVMGVTAAEDQGRGRGGGGGEEARGVGRVVLAVGVDRQGVGEALCGGGGEAGAEGCPLAAVAGVVQDLHPGSTAMIVLQRPRLQHLDRVVGRPVVDQQHRQAQAGDAAEHRDQLRGVVVAGQEDHRTEPPGRGIRRRPGRRGGRGSGWRVGLGHRAGDHRRSTVRGGRRWVGVTGDRRPATSEDTAAAARACGVCRGRREAGAVGAGLGRYSRGRRKCKP